MTFDTEGTYDTRLRNIKVVKVMQINQKRIKPKLLSIKTKKNRKKRMESAHYDFGLESRQELSINMPATR